MATSKPIKTEDIKRPSKALIKKLEGIGSATASGELRRLGIRNPYIQGPVPYTPGKSIVGPALTLQMMPKREDQYPEGEYVTSFTTPKPGTSSWSTRVEIFLRESSAR